MKIKLFIGILIAILIGLSIGYAFKMGGIKTYLAIKNYFYEKIEDAKQMGGPALEQVKEVVQLENFPNNTEQVVPPKNLTKKDFQIPDNGKTVLVDLDSMKLATYEEGKLIKEYEILSKGRQGTAWETPPGKFEILYKTENHFSSIGGVWMPYSMQFFGNYFIHGWPYYPDGTPVSEGYSGGCIRVANDEMAEIYEFADVDSTVIIKGSLPADQKDSEIGHYKIKYGAKFPKITSKAFLVADIESGEVIDASSQNVPYAIASLSKLMTALVSLETINQYKQVMVSDRAVATYGDSGSLKAGEIYEVGDLLYPLLLESSNDAAESIAEFSGRNYFISNMNEKALSIGLENTSFEDPSGLSPNNISTAEDLFNLTQYIYKYKQFILNISQKKEHTLDEKIWYSNSRFRNDENYLGGKNGYTEVAKQTLISIFELPLGEDGSETRKIAIVLLQGSETERDTRAIMKYLLANVYFVEDEE